MCQRFLLHQKLCDRMPMIDIWPCVSIMLIRWHFGQPPQDVRMGKHDHHHHHHHHQHQLPLRSNRILVPFPTVVIVIVSVANEAKWWNHHHQQHFFIVMYDHNRLRRRRRHRQLDHVFPSCFFCPSTVEETTKWVESNRAKLAAIATCCFKRTCYHPNRHPLSFSLFLSSRSWLLLELFGLIGH